MHFVWEKRIEIEDSLFIFLPFAIRRVLQYLPFFNYMHSSYSIWQISTSKQA